jgi:phosphate transport system permease protein
MIDVGFKVVCWIAAVVACLILVVLVGKLAWEGWSRITPAFFLNPPSMRFPKRAGILYPILGSLWIMGLTVLFTVPIGVGAAVYLEEFNRRKNWLTETIQVNISNLAGVPSIVYGMLGLGVFVGMVGIGKNLLAGSLTMSLLVLPVVILVTQEALRAVPQSHREASLAMGATGWDTVWRIVLPNAMPGILTGIILAAARAIGETAPLIVVGAVNTLNFAPHSVNDRYTVLPLIILDWIQSPIDGFKSVAAAAIVVLVGSLFLLNLAAIIIRARAPKLS